MRDKPLIAAPRKLDRPQVLSHSRGLQSKGFSSQILESSSVRIHKKVDSSAKVDRHADKSARDDRKRNKSYHTTQAEGFLPIWWFETTQQTTRRILGFCDDFLKKPAAATPCTAVAGFGGFQGVGAGIYLDGNEQAHRAESTKSAQKPNPKENK